MYQQERVVIRSEHDLNYPKTAIKNCCCGCSLRTGVILVAIFSFIGSIISVASLLIIRNAIELLELETDAQLVFDEFDTLFDVTLGVSIFIMVTDLCGLIGAWKFYEIPLAIFTGGIITALIFNIASYIWTVSVVSNFNLEDNITFVNPVGTIISSLLTLYYMVVTICFILQIRDTKRNPEKNMPAAGGNGQAIVVNQPVAQPYVQQVQQAPQSTFYPQVQPQSTGQPPIQPQPIAMETPQSAPPYSQ